MVCCWHAPQCPFGSLRFVEDISTLGVASSTLLISFLYPPTLSWPTPLLSAADVTKAGTMPLPVQKLAPAIARSEEAAALHRQSAGPVS